MTFPYLIAAVFIVAGLVLTARWLMDADPRLLARHLRRAAVILAALIAIVLYLRGQLALVVLLAALLLPIAMNWRSIYGRLKTGAGPTPGQSSSVSTAFLDMRLDHDSGEIDGRVRRGTFEGRDLAGMTLDELKALRGECGDGDPRSVAILDAYLDRRFGAAWRDGEDAPPESGAPTGAMTDEEAYQLLGLAPGASRSEIKAAHRRLMKQFHPDHGGSDYIAAKLNEAKALLLRE